MAGWVRVETRFISHPKVLDIGPLGEALWLRGLCYAGEQLTDGFIPTSYIKRMGDLKGLVIAARLVDAGLWEEEDGGYRIHDYLEWQRSRDEATEISSKRAEAGRRGGKQKASNLLANVQQNGSKPLADKNTEADTEEKQTPQTTSSEIPPNPPEGDDDSADEDEKSIYSEDFERFWLAYPLKKSKGAAWRRWQKVRPRPPTEVLIQAVEEQKRSFDWTKSNGEFIPHPSTWLNARGWEDEVRFPPQPIRPPLPPGWTQGKMDEALAYRAAHRSMPPEREAAVDAYLAAMNGAMT